MPTSATATRYGYLPNPWLCDAAGRVTFLGEAQIGLVERYGPDCQAEIERLSTEADHLDRSGLLPTWEQAWLTVRMVRSLGSYSIAPVGRTEASMLGYGLGWSAVCPIRYGLDFDGGGTGIWNLQPPTFLVGERTIGLLRCGYGKLDDLGELDADPDRVVLVSDPLMDAIDGLDAVLGERGICRLPPTGSPEREPLVEWLMEHGPQAIWLRDLMSPRTLKLAAPVTLGELADAIALDRCPYERIGAYRDGGMSWSQPIVDHLGSTRGLCLYQEQLFGLAVELGRFSWQEADALRKAVGKRQVEALGRMNRRFVERAGDHVASPDEANRLWHEVAAHPKALRSHSLQLASLLCDAADLHIRTRIGPEDGGIPT